MKIYSQDSKIKYKIHQKNQGYSYTLLEGLEICDADYLVLINDDDVIVSSRVQEIRERMHAADFISTSYYIDGRLIRGQKAGGVIVDAMNARGFSQHAPGIIFRVESVKNYVFFVRERIEKSCKFCFVYPQVALLFAIILTGGTAIHVDAPICEPGPFQYDSQIRSGGKSYWHPSARIEQRLDALDFLHEFRARYKVKESIFRALYNIELKAAGWQICSSLNCYDTAIKWKLIESISKDLLLKMTRKLKVFS
jgi:glycosyltransferase involved in cell wall biosynthesis